MAPPSPCRRDAALCPVITPVVACAGGGLLARRWVQKDDGSKELQHECGASANIISLYLAAR